MGGDDLMIGFLKIFSSNKSVGWWVGGLVGWLGVEGSGLPVDGEPVE